MSPTNKSADWPPNYHKTERTFSESSALSYSVNKLTLNEPAKLTTKQPRMFQNLFALNSMTKLTILKQYKLI